MYEDKDTDERILLMLEDIWKNTMDIDEKIYYLRGICDELHEQKKDIFESLKAINHSLEVIFICMIVGFICILGTLWWL